MRQICRSQILDHLGLVAAMFDELGIGDVIDQATKQNPEMRIVTAGTAVEERRQGDHVPGDRAWRLARIIWCSGIP